MAGYDELPLSINPTAALEAIYAELEEKIPGWTPAAANLEDFIISACVYRLWAPLAQLAVSIPNELFQRFGEQVVNVPPLEATRATVQSTWKMVDTAGYTILAGTVVNVPLNGGESVGFRVVSNVTVESGHSETAAGGVQLEAVIPGPEGNGLSGAASLAESLGFVASIALVGESSGGQEGETPEAYLERLTAQMQTLGPHPVIARDVEILARNTAGVARALALDGFDPESDNPDEEATWTTEKATSVAVCNSAGEPCTTGEKEAVKAELAAKREVNYLFFVLDPSYTEIDIEATIVATEGFELASVEAAVKSAIEAFLTPARWGTGEQGTATAWGQQRIIRYQDLSRAVLNTQGVAYFTKLKFAKHGGTLEEKDVTMEGAAPLPKPHTITVS